MGGVLLFGLLLIHPVAQPPAATVHKPSPFAPTLPELTEAEEKKLDTTVNRFIDADTGKLRGQEAKEAVSAFKSLKPEAVFALIRGLNRAAHIDYSCPAVTIAAKLARIFRATHDLQLLDYARENIGAGVTHSRHLGTLHDLSLLCLLRKRTLLNTGTVATEPYSESETSSDGSRQDDSPAASPKTTAELVRLAAGAKGPELGEALTELSKRGGEAVLNSLADAAQSADKENRALALALIKERLSKMSGAQLKPRLSDDHAVIRAEAARVAGNRNLHLEGRLIDLLHDAESAVRAAAHEALVRRSKGKDFGPKPDADEAERASAEKRWREWWKNQDSPSDASS